MINKVKGPSEGAHVPSTPSKGGHKTADLQAQSEKVNDAVVGKGLIKDINHPKLHLKGHVQFPAPSHLEWKSRR